MNVSSQSNFMMLTEYLHRLFRNYIINGRTRAPPESELGDLVPTFQLGAKTNRRALQSKFKSWARRMDIENGNLVLASSGKVIVPKEQCDELVMGFHSDNHQPIENIIFQIQKTYTWAKKNFGMDRQTVFNAVFNHCKKEECKVDHQNSFLGLSPFSEKIPSRYFQNFPINNSNMMSAPPKYKIWPMHSSSANTQLYPYPHKFNYGSSGPDTMVDIGYPFEWSSYGAMASFQHQLERSMNAEKINVENYNRDRLCTPSSVDLDEKTERNSVTPNKKRFLQSLGLYDATKFKSASTSGTTNNAGNSECGESTGKRQVLTRSCKKIKNISEFRKLLKSAESDPKLYPTVLSNPKTIFLSSLGLTPKRICSSKMLSRFGEEMRKKQAVEKRSWFKGRKILRDRNKIVMRKSQLENKRHSYLLASRKPTLSTALKPSLADTKWVNKSNIRFLGTRPKRTGEDIEIVCLGDDEKAKATNKSRSVPKLSAGYGKNTHEFLTKGKDSISAGQSNAPESGEPSNILKYLLLNDTRENADHQANISKISGPNLSQQFAMQSHLSKSSQVFQYPYMGPFLIPVPSATSNVAFLPHSNFPLIVRPLNPPPLSKTRQITPQKSVPMQSDQRSNPIAVWGILPGGRRSATNTNGILVNSSKPRKREFLILNKPGMSEGVLKSYRLLAPKTTTNIVKIRPIAPRTKGWESIPQRNDTANIENPNKNASQNGPHDAASNIDSTSKDVGVEMKRLSDWMTRMVTTVFPSTLGKDVEIYKTSVTAELNAGIAMVQDIRKIIIGIENNMNGKA